MAKASINFQKTKSNSVQETTRQFEAHYLLPKEYRKENEYWSIGKTDEEIFYLELAKAKRKGGRIPKPENSLWEAVLNLNQEHTMEDVKKVAEHIEKKFNIICTRIAIHRDEGKVLEGKDGSKTVKYNYHAHLNFVTYKDGKQNWRRALIRETDLAKLQTEVAEILGMERGKHNSPNVRANHRQLRENYNVIMKQREAAERAEKLEQELEQKNLTVKELKNEIEKYRKELIERNKEVSELQERVYTAEDYRALQALKKELKKDNLREIYQAFAELKDNYDKRFEQLLSQLQGKNKEIEQLKQENERLKEQVKQLQNAPKPVPQVKEKEEKIAQLQEQLEQEKAKNAQFSLLLKQQQEEIERLKAELQELKNLRYRERKEREEEIRQLKEALKGAKKELAEYQNEDFLAKMRIGELVDKWKYLVEKADKNFYDLEEKELLKINSDIDAIEEELKKYGIGLHKEEPPKAPKKSRNYGRGMGF